MDFPSSSALNTEFEEAEFLLDDKDVLLASPRKMRVNPKRGATRPANKQIKLKKRVFKCSFCSLEFESKQIIEMHRKVCNMKSGSGNATKNNRSEDFKPYRDMEDLLLDMLKGEQPADFIKMIYEEYIKRMGAAQTPNVVN